MSTTLEELRTEIDKLDKELVKTLSRRFRIVEQIGEIKKVHKFKLLDEKRREDVLDKWKNLARSEGISEKLAKDMYLLLHDYSLKIESKNK